MVIDTASNTAVVVDPADPQPVQVGFQTSGFRNSLLDYISYSNEIAKPMWFSGNYSLFLTGLPKCVRWNNFQSFLLDICHCNGQIPVFHSHKCKSRVVVSKYLGCFIYMKRCFIGHV